MMRNVMVLWLACYLPLAAQELPKKGDDKAFATYLDSKAGSFLEETGSTGLAMALLAKGRPTLVKGYGMAHVDSKKVVTADTVFNIGSISKTVAAWGVMLLVQEGQVDLDTPVESYLKSWQLPKTDFTNKGVTIRRLLSHTAGLSVHGYPGFQPKEQLPGTLVSLQGKATGSGTTGRVQTIMAPGSKWKYSGGGYTILQLLIEEISGQPFHRYMEEKVLKPLGMHHSSYALPEHLKGRMATPYGFFRNEIPLRRFSAQAAASLKVSLNDFIIFARASIPKAAGGTGGAGVLTEATLQTMYTRPPNSPNYALGHSVYEMEDGLSVGHDGDNSGWHARFRVRPETGEGIIILTNSESGNSLRRGLGCAWLNWLWDKELTKCFEVNLPTLLCGIYSDKGINAMLERYQIEKKTGLNTERFDENLLNNLGYGLLQSGYINDAVKCFELNVEEFPSAANPWDSLGEGYMNQKRYQLAIENYEKSLALDPSNTNAQKMIARIKKLQE